MRQNERAFVAFEDLIQQAHEGFQYSCMLQNILSGKLIFLLKMSFETRRSWLFIKTKQYLSSFMFEFHRGVLVMTLCHCMSRTRL